MIYSYKGEYVKLIGDHQNVLIVEDAKGKRFTAITKECKLTMLSILPTPKEIEKSPIPTIKKPTPQAPVFRSDLPKLKAPKPAQGGLF